MSGRPAGRARRLRALGLAVTALLLGACQLRTELNVEVEVNGGGTVELAVGVDDDALARIGDLEGRLRVDALRESGWTLRGPERATDGLTWIRLGHTFSRPEEVAALVAEIAGRDGPFRDFSLERRDGFATTEYALSGTVDFSGGGTGADDELTEEIETLRETSGAAVDELVRVQVAARLPGTVESNAATRADNGAVWRPSVLDRGDIHLVAVGRVQRTARLVWVGVGAAAGVAALLVGLIRVASWRRRAGSGSEASG